MIFWPRNVYLDNNATTPMASEVRKTMDRVLKKYPGNASSLHTHGRAARGIIEKARVSVAALLDCRPEQVLFTSGGTEGNNTVIKGVFQYAGKGHIITSKIEHESILGACSQVEKAGGAVTYLCAGKDGRVSVEDVKAAIRPDTVLISIMHANNETGAVQPVAAIAQLAQSRNILMHTDAVQTYGKLDTHVDELGCDFLTLSGHKINGPKGAGALYCRGTEGWQPLIYGGDQEQGLRAGTEGLHQIAGLGRAAELAAARRQQEHARLTDLRNSFVKELREIFPDVHLNEADPEYQLPGTINATFPEQEGIRLLAGLDCYEISVSIGSACTADRIEPSHVLLGMGIDEKAALATIRMSMGTVTKAKDMRYVLKVFRALKKGDPAGFAYLDPQHVTKERILSEDTFLIDLRWPFERMLSPTVPGAKEWSPIYFDRFFKRIPDDKEIIMMCTTGIFSFASGYRLANHGHKNVKVVYGGYAAWRSLYPDLIEELKKI